MDTETQLAFFNDGTTVSLVGYLGESTELELPATINVGGDDKSYTVQQGALGGLALTKLTFSALDGKLFTWFGTDVSAIPATLTELVIKAGADLDSGAFKDCTTITTVTIDCEIPNTAFDGCSSLTTVTFGPNVTEIGRNAFRDTNLTSVTMPDYSNWKMGSTAVTFENATDAAAKFMANLNKVWEHTVP